MRTPKVLHLKPCRCGCSNVGVSTGAFNGVEGHDWIECAGCGATVGPVDGDGAAEMNRKLEQAWNEWATDPSDCGGCDGLGAVWNNADETSGQCIACDCGDTRGLPFGAIRQSEALGQIMRCIRPRLDPVLARPHHNAEVIAAVAEGVTAWEDRR